MALVIFIGYFVTTPFVFVSLIWFCVMFVVPKVPDLVIYYYSSFGNTTVPLLVSMVLRKVASLEIIVKWNTWRVLGQVSTLSLLADILLTTHQIFGINLLLIFNIELNALHSFLSRVYVKAEGNIVFDSFSALLGNILGSGDDTDKHIRSVNARLDNITKSAKLIETVTVVFQHLWTSFHKLIFGETDAFILSMESFLSSYNYFVDKDLSLYDEKDCAKFLQAIQTGRRIKADLTKFTHRRYNTAMFLALCRYLEDNSAYITKLQHSYKPRPLPMSILLMGAGGTGKSVFHDFLIQYFAKKICGVVDWSVIYKAKIDHNGRLEGVSDKHIIISLDEVAQYADENKNSEEWKLVSSILDTQPFKPPQSDLANKENYIRPLVVIATSNSELHTGSEIGLKCTHAIIRRFDLIIHVTMKDESFHYTFEPTLEDLDKYSQFVLRFSRGATYGVISNIGELVNISERFFEDHKTSFEKKQVMFSKNEQYLANENLKDNEEVVAQINVYHNDEFTFTPDMFAGINENLYLSVDLEEDAQMHVARSKFTSDGTRMFIYWKCDERFRWLMLPNVGSGDPSLSDHSVRFNEIIRANLYPRNLSEKLRVWTDYVTTNWFSFMLVIFMGFSTVLFSFGFSYMVYFVFVAFPPIYAVILFVIFSNLAALNPLVGFMFILVMFIMVLVFNKPKKQITYEKYVHEGIRYIAPRGENIQEIIDKTAVKSISNEGWFYSKFVKAKSTDSVEFEVQDLEVKPDDSVELETSEFKDAPRKVVIKPETGEFKEVPRRVVVAPEVKINAEILKDVAGENISNVVRHSSIGYIFVSASGFNFSCGATCVSGDWWIVPKHLNYYTQEPDCIITLYTNSLCKSFPIGNVSTRDIPGRQVDLQFIRFPGVQSRGVYKYLPVRTDSNDYDSGHFVVLDNRKFGNQFKADIVIREFSGARYQGSTATSYENGSVALVRTVGYYTLNVETKDGDCGLPYIMYGNSVKKCGLFHFGSIKPGLATAAIVYQEDVSDIITLHQLDLLDTDDKMVKAQGVTLSKTIPEDFRTPMGLTFLGIVEREHSVFVPTKTKYEKSVLSKYHPCITQPLFLAPYKLSGIYHKADDYFFLSLTTNVKACDKNLIRWWSTIYADSLPKCPVGNDSLLSLEECINGDGILRPMVPKTSAGHKYKDYVIEGKYPLIFHDAVDHMLASDVLKSDVTCLEIVCEKFVPFVLYSDVGKDERLRIDDIIRVVDRGLYDIGYTNTVYKYRVVSAMSCDLQVLVRKYFGRWLGAMRSTHPFGHCAVGVDAVGPEWDFLFKYLTAEHGLESKFIALDNKKNDITIPYEVFAYGVLPSIHYWYGTHYSVSDREYAIRENLFIGMFTNIHIFKNMIYSRPLGLSSGCPLTTEANSCANELMHMVCFKHIMGDGMSASELRQNWSLIRTVYYGDDSCLTVPNSLTKFDQISLCDSMKVIFDMNCVSGLTGLKPVASYENYMTVTFVGRWFHYHKDLCSYVGLRNIDDCVEVALWYSKSGLTKVQATLVNVNSALRDIYLHGEDAFYLWKNKFNQWLALEGYPLVSITYLELCDSFIRKKA